MTWEEYLNDWKNDKEFPMTHEDVDTSYAMDRINVGRDFLRLSNIDVRDKKILDVAVGSGGILCAFAEKGAKCYGLDVLDYFLDMSKARFKDMDLRYEFISKWEGSGNVIPYPDGFFNFIICTDTLHHVPNWKHLVKEMGRVLKTGGKMFISEERRWFPLYILKSPHDNMPLTVLMPSFMRAFIINQSFILSIKFITSPRKFS